MTSKHPCSALFLPGSLAALLFALLLAVPAFAAEQASYALQGDCSANNLSASQYPDSSKATIACAGNSTTPLNFTFEDGTSESCLYIDNLSSTPAAFLVPLATSKEWSAFHAATTSGGTLHGKVYLTYGCNAGTVSDTCSTAPATLGAARNGTLKTVTVTPYRNVTYRCVAASGCGNWVVDSESGSCPVNGLCGAAHNVAVTSAPTTDLCAAGTATVVAGAGPWTWDCEGIAGGTTESCAAPFSDPAVIFVESFETNHNVLKKGYKHAETGACCFDILPNWNGWATSGSGIEIDYKGVIVNTVPDGVFHAELDSEDNSAMWRSFSLSAGKYEMTWYYRARVVDKDFDVLTVCGTIESMDAQVKKFNKGNGKVSTITNRIDVTITNGSGKSMGEDSCLMAPSWTQRSIDFTVPAGGGTYTIRFEAGGTDDSLGGLLDYIVLRRVDN